MDNHRRLTLELSEELAAALTILAARQGVMPEEEEATLLRDQIFQFDESLVSSDVPPYVRLANSILASAIEYGADEAPIPIRHGERNYTVTAGYIPDNAAVNGESLRLRIQPGWKPQGNA